MAGREKGRDGGPACETHGEGGKREGTGGEGWEVRWEMGEGRVHGMAHTKSVDLCTVFRRI